jgi:predicted dehydrogenase/nucleoside-diphosphate-sugar epimerase
MTTTLDRPLRVAFIGAGQMAGAHLHALERVPTEHILVGVHDLRPDAARALADRAGTVAFADLDELLAETKPDIAHVVTPAGTHFEPTRQALMRGANVYVEKPFVETQREADSLLTLARERTLLFCAGHQLMRDPAFGKTLRRAASLGPSVHLDSAFSFRPPRLNPRTASRRALAAQLLDILPHPLYTLVAALEELGTPGAAIEVVHATATPTELHAHLRAGEVSGRLFVSLRARPIVSTLTVNGTGGTLTADFARTIMLGAGNDGTSPFEKLGNPFLEAAQLAKRSAGSLARRFLVGAQYPGLTELLSEFYGAVADGLASPMTPDHLRRVSAIFETLSALVHGAAEVPRSSVPRAPEVAAAPAAPIAVVTGASGFYGRAIAREMTRAGYRVRGIGRSLAPEDPNIAEWIRADLGDALPPSALAGAALVVHAAAETAGGVEDHRRNTIDATRHLLGAMAAAKVRRLVHISSISVLRPPRHFWERQNESTPLASDPERLGPYTWAKCESETLVAQAHARHDVDARILRPAALIDLEAIELPGLVGRRLFGDWCLGLGRPGLPFAVCDVNEAARAVAWSAGHFEKAPAVVNLIDPDIGTRGELITFFRAQGWRGRMLWVPISFLAGALFAVQLLKKVISRTRSRSISGWSVLRPRRYDPAVSATLLAAVRGAGSAVHA